MLSIEEIKHVAGLARLSLSDEELDRYGGQLSAVLGYIDQLKEVDTEGVEECAQVTGLENVYREDKAEVWANKERVAALSQAPGFEDSYIKVKKVL